MTSGQAKDSPADTACPSSPSSTRARDDAPVCVVCEREQVSLFEVIDDKTYWRCAACRATFLDRASFPALDEEIRHYAFHQNDVDDEGYRRFLDRLAAPLLERLPPARRGLDYGCGPGPALAAMLRDAGHEVHVYDPIFAPDPAALRRSYDFIACTETAEHFHAPAKEFARLTDMLRPGGVLAIMTCFQTEDARFAEWHYRKDPTHVVFYREETFRFLAAQWGWRAEIPAKDNAFLFKPSSAAGA